MPSPTDSRYAIPGFISILVLLGILAVGNQSFEPLRPSAKENVDYSESQINLVEARLWQDPFNAVEAFDASGAAAAERESASLKTVEAFAAAAERASPALKTLEAFYGAWLKQVQETAAADEAMEYHSELNACIQRQLLRATDKVADPLQCQRNTLDTTALAQWAKTHRSADLFAVRVRDELASQGASGKRVILLPVTLPGGDYADLIERRRRSRYAVVAALTQQGFLPNNSEYLHVLRDHVMRCDSPGDCVTRDVPYEYFDFKPLLAGKEAKGKGWVALVLWLHDGSLDKTLRPAVEALTVALERRLESDDGKRRVHSYLLGPYNSSSLPPPTDHKHLKDPNEPGFINVINWSATNRTNTVEDSGWDPKSTLPPIVHAISTDSEFLRELSSEVEYRVRGRAPATPPACTKTQPVSFGDTQQTGDRTVLLISEGDTGYATYLNSCAKQMFAQMNYRVYETAYIRGIDGQYPGHSPRKPEDNAAQNKNSKSVSASLLQAGYVETSAGTSQFDYLRRLAKNLGEQGKRIDAIGVLGSDPYDKVLVLQAMRSEYPKAVYFTTDLYSLFLRDDSYSIYRNLLVAASHDLKPTETGDGISGRTWPPLRDSYQSALYEAASIAASAALNNISPEELGKHRARARVFEVGRGQTFELRNTAQNSNTDTHEWHWLAFWVVFLVTLFCASFVIALHVITYREANNAVRPEGDRIARRSIPLAASITLLVGATIAALVLFAPADLQQTFSTLIEARYQGHTTPSVGEQTIALALLLLACGCCLTFMSVRPRGLGNAAQQGGAGDDEESKPRDTQLRSVLSLTVVACFLTSYFVIWWLPVLLPTTNRELWSLTQGVSAWPPVGFSVLIVGLSFVAYYFLRTRKLFLADDLNTYFGVEHATTARNDNCILDELKHFQIWLLEDKELRFKNRGVYFLHVLILLLGFALISLVDNGGELLLSLSFRGGVGSIDIAQLIIAVVVALFSVSLFLLGRESRKILEAIRNQDTQRADVRIQRDGKTLHRLLRGNAALERLVDTGAWIDGPLTEHARAYFANNTSAKAQIRRERFSKSIKNAIVDVELVEAITKQIQRLFYIPVVILLLFAVAALPLFDPWPISRPVLLFGCLVTTALVLQAWRLDYAARGVQKNLIAVLGARKASIEHMPVSATKTTAFVAMLDYAIHTIQSEHEGAFLPLTALPLVRILVLTVGALGLILSQAIFGIGYSL